MQADEGVGERAPDHRLKAPQAVKRIAVRFSTPLFPAETVTTRVWNVNGGFGFESVNPQSTAVLKDGRLELR